MAGLVELKDEKEKSTEKKGAEKKITDEMIRNFRKYLEEEERAEATIEKYMREIKRLAEFLHGEELQKEKMIEYRKILQQKYHARTVNGKLSALNAYFEFSGNGESRVRYLKVQHSAFIDEARELEDKEYKRLLRTARRQKNERMYYVLLTLSGTGIRVSELKYITAEAVSSGKSEINLKGKNRKILLTKELRKKLKEYMRKEDIETGPIFATRNGNPLDRSNIWHEMKKLCEAANVDESKVFPHNLRHLFARKYYEIDNNLPHLADILGHSSIETTRIYVAASAKEYEKVLDQMSFI